jgi:hypothetical protein
LGASDEAAVRILTSRIAEGLRQLTVNLERWEDQPLVDCAMRIWEAERGAPPDPEERVARMGATTRIMAAVRHDQDRVGMALEREVEAHRRRLKLLGLRPADLVSDVGLVRGAVWAARRALPLPFEVAVATVGWLLWWPPYRLTGVIVRKTRPPFNQISTHKLLAGILVYGLWLFALTAVGAAVFNVWVGLGVLLGAPVVGMVGLVIRERWRGATRDAQRFFLLRSRRVLMDTLRATQRDLGVRLDALYHRFAAADPPRT